MLPAILRVSSATDPVCSTTAGDRPFLICWRSTFPAVRIIGFQTRDRQQQAIVILAFQAVDDNLLGSIMIVTLNKMFRHCHLQGHLMTRFPALVFHQLRKPSLPLSARA